MFRFSGNSRRASTTSGRKSCEGSGSRGASSCSGSGAAIADSKNAAGETGTRGACRKNAART